MSAVLVLSAGSSTIKYRLATADRVLGSGIVERIGEDGARILHRHADGAEWTVERPVADHKTGFRLLFDELDHPPEGLLAVGHRIVHGGARFTESPTWGNDRLIMITVVIVVVMTVRWRSRTPLLLLAIGTADSLPMAAVGKDLVECARPPIADAVPVRDLTRFPGGHALNNTVVACLVAYLLLLCRSCLGTVRTPWSHDAPARPGDSFDDDEGVEAAQEDSVDVGESRMLRAASSSAAQTASSSRTLLVLVPRQQFERGSPYSPGRVPPAVVTTPPGLDQPWRRARSLRRYIPMPRHGRVP